MNAYPDGECGCALESQLAIQLGHGLEHIATSGHGDIGVRAGIATDAEKRQKTIAEKFVDHSAMAGLRPRMAALRFRAQ